MNEPDDLVPVNAQIIDLLDQIAGLGPVCQICKSLNEPLAPSIDLVLEHHDLPEFLVHIHILGQKKHLLFPHFEQGETHVVHDPSLFKQLVEGFPLFAFHVSELGFSQVVEEEIIHGRLIHDLPVSHKVASGRVRKLNFQPFRFAVQVEQVHLW